MDVAARPARVRLEPLKPGEDGYEEFIKPIGTRKKKKVRVRRRVQNEKSEDDH